MQKQKVAKTFTHPVRDSGSWDFRFCEFVDSALDSTNPQNPHKKHKIGGCVVRLIGVGKEGRILLFAKAKSGKNF